MLDSIPETAKVAMLAAGSIGAGVATWANQQQLHDLATICGGLATILTALAAAFRGVNAKRSRRNRARKPRAIPPASTTKKDQ